MKRLNFDIESAEIVDEPFDSQFATARIEAFSTGRSLHDTLCDEETLQRTAPTIYEKPIIFNYDNRLGDFGGHSTNPVISGFVVKNSAEFKTTDDGRITLSVFAKIWKKYAPKFLQVFKDTNKKNKGVSVEIEITDAEDTSEGFLNLKDFVYSAICVLGDYVTEASPGANIQMLSFAKEENEEYKKAYELEFSDKYEEIEFVIPSSVKKNVSKALESKKGSSVALAMGRWILKNEKLTPEKVKSAWAFLKNKNMDEMDETTFGLYGGKQGYKLFKSLFEKMKEVDDKRLSYFSNEENTENKDEKEFSDESSENKVKEDTLNMAEEKDDKVKEEEKEAPAEEEKENFAEENKEEEKAEEKKFSLDAFLDVVAALAFLEAETEANEEMAGKIGFAVEELKKGAEFADGGKVMAGMYAKMFCMKDKMMAMEEQNKVYMAENEELKKFKADVEESQKNFAIDTTLKELSDKVIISEEAMTDMRDKAKEFSFAEIEGWKNYCKAKSFDFAVKPSKKKDEDDIVRIGFPFTSTSKPAKDDLWQ